MRHLARRLLRSRWFLWAATAFVLIRSWQFQQQVQIARQRWAATETLLVAAEGVAAGRVVDLGEVEERGYPVALVPEGALRKASDLRGRRARVDLRPGVVITSEMLAPSRASRLQVRVGKGARGIEISLRDGQSQLHEGDSVDVFAAVQREGERLALDLVCVGEVVAVSEQTALVSVPERTTAVVVQKAAVGEVFLALRGDV